MVIFFGLPSYVRTCAPSLFYYVNINSTAELFYNYNYNCCDGVVKIVVSPSLNITFPDDTNKESPTDIL